MLNYTISFIRINLDFSLQYTAISSSALGRKPSWVSGLAQALLEKEDVNILVVDWLCGASFAYNQVVDNYKEVAVQISILINQLMVSVLY